MLSTDLKKEKFCEDVTLNPKQIFRSTDQKEEVREDVDVQGGVDEARVVAQPEGQLHGHHDGAVDQQ